MHLGPPFHEAFTPPTPQPRNHFSFKLNTSFFFPLWALFVLGALFLVFFFFLFHVCRPPFGLHCPLGKHSPPCQFLHFLPRSISSLRCVSSVLTGCVGESIRFWPFFPLTLGAFFLFFLEASLP